MAHKFCAMRSGQQAQHLGSSLFGGSANGITETDSGTVLLNTGFSNLTSLNGISFTVDATSSLPISQLTSLTDGGITVEGGSYTLSNLADVDGSNIQAKSGIVSHCRN